MKFGKWDVVFYVVLLITAVVFGVLFATIAGCGNAEVSAGSVSYSTFDMEKIGSDWMNGFYIYEDIETHVQYIVYERGEAVAITPRYFDYHGTLYSSALEE